MPYKILSAFPNYFSLKSSISIIAITLSIIRLIIIITFIAFLYLTILILSFYKSKKYYYFKAL